MIDQALKFSYLLVEHRKQLLRFFYVNTLLTELRLNICQLGPQKLDFLSLVFA